MRPFQNLPGQGFRRANDLRPETAAHTLTATADSCRGPRGKPRQQHKWPIAIPNRKGGNHESEMARLEVPRRRRSANHGPHINGFTHLLFALPKPARSKHADRVGRGHRSCLVHKTWFYHDLAQFSMPTDKMDCKAKW